MQSTLGRHGRQHPATRHVAQKHTCIDLDEAFPGAHRHLSEPYPIAGWCRSCKAAATELSTATARADVGVATGAAVAAAAAAFTGVMCTRVAAAGACDAGRASRADASSSSSGSSGSSSSSSSSTGSTATLASVVGRVTMRIQAYRSTGGTADSRTAVTADFAGIGLVTMVVEAGTSLP
eukprot:363712-Chlamydomonas_euryale.AAC.13